MTHHCDDIIVPSSRNPEQCRTLPLPDLENEEEALRHFSKAEQGVSSRDLMLFGPLGHFPGHCCHIYAARQQGLLTVHGEELLQ